MMVRLLVITLMLGATSVAFGHDQQPPGISLYEEILECVATNGATSGGITDCAHLCDMHAYETDGQAFCSPATDPVGGTDIDIINRNSGVQCYQPPVEDLLGPIPTGMTICADDILSDNGNNSGNRYDDDFVDIDATDVLSNNGNQSGNRNIGNTSGDTYEAGLTFGATHDESITFDAGNVSSSCTDDADNPTAVCNTAGGDIDLSRIIDGDQSIDRSGNSAIDRAGNSAIDRSGNSSNFNLDVDRSRTTLTDGNNTMRTGAITDGDNTNTMRTGAITDGDNTQRTNVTDNSEMRIRDGDVEVNDGDIDQTITDGNNENEMDVDVGPRCENRNDGTMGDCADSIDKSSQTITDGDNTMRTGAIDQTVRSNDDNRVTDNSEISISQDGDVKGWEGDVENNLDSSVDDSGNSSIESTDYSHTDSYSESSNENDNTSNAHTSTNVEVEDGDTTVTQEGDENTNENESESTASTDDSGNSNVAIDQSDHRVSNVTSVYKEAYRAPNLSTQLNVTTSHCINFIGLQLTGADEKGAGAIGLGWPMVDEECRLEKAAITAFQMENYEAGWTAYCGQKSVRENWVMRAKFEGIKRGGFLGNGRKAYAFKACRETGIDTQKTMQNIRDELEFLRKELLIKSDSTDYDDRALQERIRILERTAHLPNATFLLNNGTQSTLAPIDVEIDLGTDITTKVN